METAVIVGIVGGNGLLGVTDRNDFDSRTDPFLEY